MTETADPSVARDPCAVLIWGFLAYVTLMLAFLFLGVCAHFYSHFPSDLRIAHAIQGIDVPAFGGFMNFMNFIGGEKMYIALTIGFTIGFAALRAPWEALFVLLMAIPTATGEIAKGLIARPRPSRDLLQMSGETSGHGFPSGHTLGTAALFGVLLFLVPAVVPWRPLRWLMQAGCALLVVAAGPARVYVGAHWPSDVLGSYTLVLAFLMLFIAAYVALGRRSRPLPRKATRSAEE